MARVKTWAGDPLLPTSFGRCLRTHFLYRPRGMAQMRWRPHIKPYLDDGQEAEHAAQLAELGIDHFAYMGTGQDSFVMRARSADDRALVLRFSSNIKRRPDHPLILPALHTQRPAAGKKYGYEILPRTKTKGITEDDVLNLAVALASSGMWVEDLHDENIGHWRGRLVVFDVGNGAYDYWDRPKAFNRSLRTFVRLNRRRMPNDARLLALQAIVDGDAKPQRPAPAKPPRPLAVPRTQQPHSGQPPKPGEKA